MEKLEKKKHDHKATKILKFLIFMFVMFAPFFSILSKCLYTLNPNAKESYYGETINQIKYEKIDSINKLNNSDTFNFYANRGQQYTTNNNLTVYITEFKDNDNLPLNFTPTLFIFYTANNVLQMQFRDGNSNIQQLDNANYTFNFNFKYISQSGALTNENFIQFLNKIEYNKYSYIDNVFEYAVDQLKNDSIYNWSKNTGVYTAINGMVEGLGANNVLSMLLAYWSILTAIYIVIDIVIEVFVKLTHMFTE